MSRKPDDQSKSSQDVKTHEGCNCNGKCQSCHCRQHEKSEEPLTGLEP